jgi:hypothetical protein
MLMKKPSVGPTEFSPEYINSQAKQLSSKVRPDLILPQGRLSPDDLRTAATGFHNLLEQESFQLPPGEIGINLIADLARLFLAHIITPQDAMHMSSLQDGDLETFLQHVMYHYRNLTLSERDKGKSFNDTEALEAAAIMHQPVLNRLHQLENESLRPPYFEALEKFGTKIAPIACAEMKRGGRFPGEWKDLMTHVDAQIKWYSGNRLELDDATNARIHASCILELENMRREQKGEQASAVAARPERIQGAATGAIQFIIPKDEV